MLYLIFFYRTEVLCQWEIKKQDLDQIYQLKLFEQDAENVHYNFFLILNFLNFFKLYQWIRTQHDQIFSSLECFGSSELDIDHALNEHLGFECLLNVKNFL